MTPDGIREKFELYRKWFRTLLVIEFMNLPAKSQETFMILVDKFKEDCNNILQEHKSVKEKDVKFTVERILPPDNPTESYSVCGHVEGISEEIKMSLPVSCPKPSIGKKMVHTVYSIDGETWYSSKQELIAGGTQ